MTGRIEITDKDREELRFHRKRTGIGPVAILRGHGPELPPGLRADITNRLLSGALKTIRADHLSFLQARWREMPSEEDIYVELTPEIRRGLRSEKTRTGVGEHRLLKGRSDIPEGLRYAHITAWLHEKKTKRMPRAHYDYVMALWFSLPDKTETKTTKTARGPKRVAITSEILARLENFRQQNLLPGKVLKGECDFPAGLSAPMISSWLNRTVDKAREDHLEFVLARCETLSNDPARPITISEAMLKELRTLDAKLNCSRVELIAAEAPDGLSAGMIGNWFSRTTTTVRRDHWKYVIARYEALTESR